MNFDQMIQLIVEEVLKKIQHAPKKAIVAFTGGDIGFEKSISQLNKLKENGWDLKIVLSSSVERILDIEKIRECFGTNNIFIDGEVLDIKELYEHMDTLIIPTLTINSAAKISTGIADTLPTQLAARCIMNGTPVIAVKDACDLNNTSRAKLGYNRFPNTYFEMIKGHIDRIESYGVKLIDIENLYNYAMNINKASINNENELKERAYDSECILNKKIISREDIVINSMKNKIIIPQNAIITSLAKDVALEKGVEIIKR